MVQSTLQDLCGFKNLQSYEDNYWKCDVTVDSALTLQTASAKTTKAAQKQTQTPHRLTKIMAEYLK